LRPNKKARTGLGLNTVFDYFTFALKWLPEIPDPKPDHLQKNPIQCKKHLINGPKGHQELRRPITFLWEKSLS